MYIIFFFIHCIFFSFCLLIFALFNICDKYKMFARWILFSLFFTPNKYIYIFIIVIYRYSVFFNAFSVNMIIWFQLLQFCVAYFVKCVFEHPLESIANNHFCFPQGKEKKTTKTSLFRPRFHLARTIYGFNSFTCNLHRIHVLYSVLPRQRAHFLQ